MALFLPFGPIIDILLPIDNKAKNTSRGFADVQFENIGDAEAAIDNMEGAEVYGKVLRVRRSTKEGPKLDQKKAVWEQVTAAQVERQQAGPLSVDMAEVS